MGTKTSSDDEGQTLCKAIVEIDSRLTLPAKGLEAWLGNFGADDLATLVCMPGFPAPTDDTAHLPLEQREWPFAAVFHQMLLRVEGVEVCRPGEREETRHIPCSLFIEIYKID